MPICGFRKADGTTCTRKIAYCWQHNKGYRGVWQAVVRNRTVLFLLALGSVMEGSPIVMKIFSTPRVVTKVVVPLASENLITRDTVAVSVRLAGAAPAQRREQNAH